MPEVAVKILSEKVVVLHENEALGVERAFLGRGVSESLALIYIFKRKLLSEYSEILCIHQYIVKSRRIFSKSNKE